MDYSILTGELQADPLSRGYAGMTDAQRMASLKALDRPSDRGVVPAYEVIEAIVPAEWASLTAQEKQRVQTIVSAGQVNLKGPNTRASLAAAFGAGTQTRTNLLALQAGPAINRASELGIADVGMGHLASARDMLTPQVVMMRAQALNAPKLHPHQMTLLVVELISGDYAGVSSDEAFARVNSKEVLVRLGRVALPALPEFPSGTPGFPNRVSRDDFSTAWQQAGRV